MIKAWHRSNQMTSGSTRCQVLVASIDPNFFGWSRDLLAGIGFVLKQRSRADPPD
jgi:hypothetical protein